MAGADHGLRSEGVCRVPGEWGCSFVDMLGNPAVQEQPCQPRVAAGVVGNHHFAGVKVIVFCS